MKLSRDNLVIIGIPIYKSILNDLERISLEQVRKMLGHYPIAFIGPQSLRFDYGSEYSSFKVERFPDEYFHSTSSYSQLLLSEDFYQRFSEYQFLLIYQLDAFVFSDRLEEFCHLNFDYIGAPVPKVYWPYVNTIIGNGGFSLRKIKSMINALRNRNRLYIDPLLEDDLNKAEDIFFAFCSTKKELEFKVPSLRKAFAFSMEYDVYHCFRNLNKQLPFGCHGWYRTHFDVWKPYIEAYGYQLAGLPGENQGLVLLECKKRRLSKYLSKRIIREGKSDWIKLAFVNCLDIKKEYRIWGGGEDGRRCLALLARAQIPIGCIYDSKAQENQFLSGIMVKKNCDSEIEAKQSVIIIATKTYGQEIANKLEGLGLKREINFLFFDELEQEFIKQYYRNFTRFFAKRKLLFEVEDSGISNLL